MNRPKPTMLIVLDGWGINPRTETNAVAQARTPYYDELLTRHPHTQLDASGESVGLPDRQMGNSEVGHLNLGAGRIVYQELTRIHRAIREGSFFENPTLLQAVKAARAQDSTLHILGLVSDGGVHSHLDHILALVDLAKRHGLTGVRVHAFLDGRDTPPASGKKYIMILEDGMKSLGAGKVATITGRYYAMDRDNRWDRVKLAYDALVMAEGHRARSAVEAVEEAYRQGETDEFIKPVVLVDVAGKPVGRIQDNDAVIFANFRADRAREITRALTDPGFDGFPRAGVPALSAFVCMTEYDETFDLPVAFSNNQLPNLFGEVISRHGLRQLRIAETEKYAHVTYFFNGGEEQTFPGEDRVLIPSPRDVKTYDQKPEMSALAVTQEVLRRIEAGTYDFILLNFANPDMVGHTGILPAAIRAAETIDGCLAQIVEAVLAKGGVVLITADHGNLEQMLDPQTGSPHTAHTSNLVPFILVGRQAPLRNGGILADVAPTLLSLMGLEKPAEMTGEPIITRAAAEARA